MNLLNKKEAVKALTEEFRMEGRFLYLGENPRMDFQGALSLLAGFQKEMDATLPHTIKKEQSKDRPHEVNQYTPKIYPAAGSSANPAFSMRELQIAASAITMLAQDNVRCKKSLSGDTVTLHNTASGNALPFKARYLDKDYLKDTVENLKRDKLHDSINGTSRDHINIIGCAFETVLSLQQKGIGR